VTVLGSSPTCCSTDQPVLQVIALIVSPTRELAVQTHRVAQPFLRAIPGCTLTSLIGGTSVADDVEQVRRGLAVSLSSAC
jgi:superfamily II DNA/RNA helicase